MNFLEAVKEMKEGKKVKRENWGKGTDVGFKLKKPQEIIPIILPNGELNKEGESVKLILSDFEATDWEIYEEKKTLSDKITDTSQSASTSENTEFQTLKVKDVKQALKEYIDSFTRLVVGDLHKEIMFAKAREIFGEELV